MKHTLYPDRQHIRTEDDPILHITRDPEDHADADVFRAILLFGKPLPFGQVEGRTVVRYDITPHP